MPNDAQLPLRYFEMLRHLQQDDDPQGPQQATVHVDPAAQGLAADRLRALLVRPPTAPDVPLPKQGPLDWFMKAAMLAQGALGINEPKPEEFKTPEDLQQARNYYGPAAMAGVLLGGPGAFGAVSKALGAGKEALTGVTAGKDVLTAGEEALQTPAMVRNVKVPADLSPNTGIASTDAFRNLRVGQPHPYYDTAETLSSSGLQREYFRLRGLKDTTGDVPEQIRVLEDVAKQRGWSLGGLQTATAAEEAAPAVKGITAYHGSPADFEAFSAEKIGTGEGGRLLGHGHNFTEREARAAQYKPEGGHMYEVNINAPPEHFLNWDVPMNEQSPHVQAAVERLPVEYMPSLVPRDAKGGELMHAMSKNVGAQEGEGFFTKGPHPDVSKELKDAGIVGTVGGTLGTRDFVVYPGNEHLIEIMKKYGVTLPVAAEIYRRQQAQAHDPGADSSTPFTLSK